VTIDGYGKSRIVKRGAKVRVKAEREVKSLRVAKSCSRRPAGARTGLDFKDDREGTCSPGNESLTGNGESRQIRIDIRTKFLVSNRV
jgi:hypothetical protein